METVGSTVEPVALTIGNNNMWKLFDLVGYRVHHPEVRKFHESNARVKVAVAPRRTTKSYGSAHDALPTIMKPQTRVWVVGPSYSLSEKEFRYIHEAMVIKGRHFGLPKPKVCQTNARSGSLYMEWPWGAVVEGKSADRPDSLLGEAVDVVIYSEAAELPRHIRERFVAPTLNTRKGREIVPTTPQTKAEWVHELWDAGFSPEYPEIESFQWDRTANPEYDNEEFERARKFYGEDSPVFREQYLGEWVYYGGMVYNNYSPDVHPIEPFDIPKHWRVIRGIDFGHRDPFVCLWAAVGPHNELYVFQEMYNEEGRPMRENAMQIKAMSAGWNIYSSVGDPSEKQSIEDLNYEGVACMSANNDRVAGRVRVLEYLARTEDAQPPYPLQGGERPTGQFPRLYVFKTCKQLLREFKFYRWKEGRAVENDKEKTEGDDHAMDALRYLCMTRPSPFKSVRKLTPGSFSAIMNKIKNENNRRGFIR